MGYCKGDGTKGTRNTGHGTQGAAAVQRVSVGGAEQCCKMAKGFEARGRSDTVSAAVIAWFGGCTVTQCGVLGGEWSDGGWRRGVPGMRKLTL